MKLSDLKKIIKEEVKLNEAPKIKANQKISKKEWRKIKSFNKHIGQDGTHYVMQLTNKGTALVPVVVEGKLSEGVFGKFDMGAGAKGNGITIWDRNQNQGGDYKTIAHISDDGKLKIYDNDVKKEKELMKRISIMVKAQKDYWKSVGHQMEGKLTEGTRTTTFGIPETDKKAVKQIIQKLKLKHGEHYDFGVGRGATFVLSVYKKYESAIVDAFKKYRVRFKEVR